MYSQFMMHGQKNIKLIVNFPNYEANCLLYTLFYSS